MSINSRQKGANGEREFIKLHLAEHWPETRRNLEQHTEDKRDCLDTGDLHWQIKRTERLELWAAIKQAESEALSAHIPLVAFRRNRSKWYVVAPADYLVPVLAKEARRAA